MPDGKEAEEIKKIEKNPFYYRKFGVMLVVLVLSIAVALLRGGKSRKSVIGLATCSSPEWLILGGYVLLMVLLPVYTKTVVFREQAKKKRIGWDLGDKEVTFSLQTFIFLTIFSSGAGLVSTIIGIGGGLLFTPYLLKLGYSPIVSSWTINVSTLLSKIAAVIVNYMIGDILLSYVWMYGGIICVLTIISENAILMLVKRLNS